VLAVTFAHHPILFLLGLAISGLIVGGIARLVVPGRTPLGCLGTMAAGIAGSFAAGLAGKVLFGRGYSPGWIASILGAIFVVWLFSRSRRTYY
jgi:uncharacterized membrane protein YeaQ/YmgE (transglycosylase-associated protein family)